MKEKYKNMTVAQGLIHALNEAVKYESGEYVEGVQVHHIESKECSKTKHHK